VFDRPWPSFAWLRWGALNGSRWLVWRGIPASLWLQKGNSRCEIYKSEPTLQKVQVVRTCSATRKTYVHHWNYGH